MHKKIVFSFIALLLLCVFSQVSLAQTYHTTLMTVSEENNSIGGTADLYLDIKPGTGRIFIDSFPVSKADTQFSTRFANEVACDFLKKDCSQYDFFYTIRANSAIVGGPSAGAATTILTVAALDKQKLRQDVAMTGTINSGGVVGPVAGILAKTKAAKAQGMSVVIIPSLSSLGLELLENRSNITNVNFTQEFDSELIENLSDETFTIVRATDLYDALPFFIEKEYPAPDNTIVIPQEYTDVMENVAQTLCARNEWLSKELATQNEAINETIKDEVDQAFEEKRYYSAASFCFSDNIDKQRERLANVSENQLLQQYRGIQAQMRLLDSELTSRNLSTIADVETYGIVRERIIEAETLLMNINKTNISSYDLAYAIERGYSATVWADFFAMDSPRYTINDKYLEIACVAKLTEADERITYIETYLPESFTKDAREELQFAYKDKSLEEYSLCLFKASKAKAKANILSSILSVDEKRVPLLVEEKLRAVERVLARQADDDLFPIMGYSYYEYAKSLQEDDPYSALRFAEYSLELGNMQMYFPKEKTWHLVIDWRAVVMFVCGLLAGSSATLLLIRKSRRNSQPVPLTAQKTSQKKQTKQSLKKSKKK